MKPKPFIRSFMPSGILQSLRLVVTCAAIWQAGISSLHAANYYWDSNGTTAGLGDTGSLVWGTSTNIASLGGGNSRNVVLGTFTVANTATTTSDWIYFGTVNLSLGSAASTIGIVGGGRSINSIVIGAGQSNAVTLGGGAITLPASGGGVHANNAQTNTISSVLTGATTSFTKGGPGTLILTGANLYTGTTIVRGGGILNIGDGTTGSLNGTIGTALTFNNGGGTFNLAQADTSSQGMAALAFSGGHGTVTSTAAAGSATQTLTFASLALRGLGATGNFSLATNTTAAQNKIVLTDTTGAPLDSGSNDAGYYFGGSEYARYDSVNGYFRAVVYGTDTNALAPLSGTDLGAVTSVTDVKLNGAVTAQTTAAVNTIHLDGNTLTLQDADQVLDVNGILSNGGSIAAAGKLQGTTGGGEIVFNVTGGNLSVASIIQDSRLTKTGAGTLTLSGANTYGGVTTINAGTLAVSGGSAIEDTSAVVLADAAGATFQLDNDETIGNLSGGGLAGGNVNVQANTLTLSDNTNTTFGGQFTGTGGLTKTGTGILTLSHPNSFAGTFALSAGAVRFALGNNGSGSALSISSGGTIAMSDGTTLRFDPVADLTSGNLGTALAPPNGFTISNPITVSDGTASMRFMGNDAKFNFTGGVTGATSGAQTLAIYQGGINSGSGDRQDILFSGAIQDGSGGTLGVGVDFAGTSSTSQGAFVNLGGPNTFTGPISVANSKGMTNGAFLVIGGQRTSTTTGITPGSGYLGGGDYPNTISLATGTILDYASSADQILGGVISGTGAILKEGVGTLTLSGANTFDFALPGGTPALTVGVAIRQGTLSVGSLNSVVGGSAASNLGTPTTVAAGTISIGNTTTAGQLTYTGGGETTDRVINLAGTTGGAIIDQSGTGLLKFTSNFSATGNGIKTLTLQGSTAGTGEIAGNIVNSTSATSVTKTGSGTWTLSGANTYTGATTVNGGTLTLGVDDSLADTSNVVIGAGILNLPASVNDTAGGLDVTAGATINLGTGASLVFADSNLVDWTGGTLNITGDFTNTSIKFATSGGLTVDQLAVISVNGSGPVAIDGNGYLTTGTVSGFAAWQAANSTGGGLGDDHDGDGVDNGTEFFIYGPVANSGFTALPPVVNTGGTLSVTWTKAATYGGSYTTDYMVETSDNLTGWSPAATNGSPNVADSVYIDSINNTVTYTFPNPLGTKKFARLKVTGPN